MLSPRWLKQSCSSHPTKVQEGKHQSPVYKAPTLRARCGFITISLADLEVYFQARLVHNHSHVMVVYLACPVLGHFQFLDKLMEMSGSLTFLSSVRVRKISLHSPPDQQ